MTKLSLHFDGLIFGIQRHGGIHRFTQCLLQSLAKCELQQLTLAETIPFVAEMDWLPKDVIVRSPACLRLRPGRVFARFNSYLQRKALDDLWREPNQGFFVSTYYSTYPSLRIPQVTFFHDLIFELFPDITLTEKQLQHKRDKEFATKQADLFICPSLSAQSDLEKIYNVPRQRIVVVPYGVESDFRELTDTDAIQQFRNSITGGKGFLLTVGGREGTKNFTPLMMAYSRWSGRQDFDLLNIGGGPFNNQENSVIRALRLEGKVRCIPAVDNKTLVIAYNAAHALIVPSLYEGYGFPVLEALACGTPVAASNASSLPEVGADAAIYFDPCDNDSILESLESVVSLGTDRERKQRGKEHAAALSWDRCANQVVDVVSRLV